MRFRAAVQKRGRRWTSRRREVASQRRMVEREDMGVVARRWSHGWSDRWRRIELNQLTRTVADGLHGKAGERGGTGYLGCCRLWIRRRRLCGLKN
ncbi:hypothetical protein M0R45_031852 [Rubus argutus]|uniref:Uncharacterized protein n=1 Tax=Rubus argutus TaxID=59490 RepID=A0AAW1WH02_RUBAR